MQALRRSKSESRMFDEHEKERERERERERGIIEKEKDCGLDMTWSDG